MNELQLVSDCANPSYVASSSRKREATACVMDIPIVIYIYIRICGNCAAELSFGDYDIIISDKEQEQLQRCPQQGSESCKA